MAYVAVAVEGGLFPFDLLDRVGSGDIEGQRSEDFGLKSARLTDEFQSAFSDIRTFWDALQRRSAHSRESATTLTRRGWMEPCFERLGFSLVTQRSLSAGGEGFPIAFTAGDEEGAPPVHVVAVGQSLEHRSEGSRRSPHALVQEYLNRSDALWGIVTNGERLRLLRNSARMARPTYLEFDLRGIVDGNLYNEFVLLYRLLHRSRFPSAAADAHQCRLEQYYQQGIDEGGRVREKLREGVEAALRDLGTAFLLDPDSERLRDAIRSRRLNEADYYRQLLRLVYRILFLFVAEERHLLLAPTAPNIDRQQIYTRYYSLSRLRQQAERHLSEDHHGDLWQGILRTFELFRHDNAAEALGLSPLDGELFGQFACPDLERAACENRVLLKAIYDLSTFVDAKVRRRVNYASLDVEELGSVYESLLDYHPQVTIDETPHFDLVAGSERRQTGSYYTPPELVRELITQALVPLVTERLVGATSKEDKETALLGLKVCDPASGSGHFLLAAARHIGRELAKVRTGEDEPGLASYRSAVRDVIRNCIYAVDRNPLAVDLCKVALWLEGYDVGLPLSFLDHHVKCGDSLVGVPDLLVLARGVPDEAFSGLSEDSNSGAAYYKKRNRAEREHRQQSLEGFAATAGSLTDRFAGDFNQLAALEERSTDEVHAKEHTYESLRGEGGVWWTYKVACDLWTSSFFVPKQLPDREGTETVPTTDTIRRSITHPNGLYGPMVAQAVVVAQRRAFFHWSLEFPDVFQRGGFDAVIGNPPFLKGLRISETLGNDYRTFLATTYRPSKGLADLCAYFFRRGHTILRSRGLLGMVATNTIGQGDTRDTGLAPIVAQGNDIVFARRFIRWPGAASVEVNLVCVRKGSWDRSRTLDGNVVDFISSRLDDEVEYKPQPLIQNRGKAFIGSYVLGMGFVLNPAEAMNLIEKDIHYQDCLKRYINGENFNTDPRQEPWRYVIDFHDWGLERCREYPDLLSIVERNVKPERDRLNSSISTQAKRKKLWWQFAAPATQLYAAILHHKRVIARSLTGDRHALGYLENGLVYDQTLIVFALQDDYSFALLQSAAHEAWVWKYGPTLRTDKRYSVTECFDTFAFPQDPDPQEQARAATVAAKYDEHRKKMMISRNIGLTKTYNLVNNANCKDQDVVRLRELAAEMDQAILACYGWGDLDLEHAFHQNERGQTRHTISATARRELLRRLSDLNYKLAQSDEANAADLKSGYQLTSSTGALLTRQSVHETFRTPARKPQLFPIHTDPVTGNVNANSATGREDAQTAVREVPSSSEAASQVSLPGFGTRDVTHDL